MFSIKAGETVEVDDETVEYARKANSPLLLLSGTPPILQQRLHPPGAYHPVTAMKENLDGRWEVADPEPVPATTDATDPDAPAPLSYPCSCGRTYPHPAARARHQEVSCPDRARA